MSISSKATTRFLPHVRYRDVEGSARWLCNTFGFSVHAAVLNTDGVMDYVHLTHGPANVVIKPFDEREEIGQAGGEQPQSYYIYIGDVARHYEVAKAEGAQIVIDLQDLPRLGRGYSCRDVEGLIWSFGSFDPWQIGLLPATTEHVPEIQDDMSPLPSSATGLGAETASAVGTLPAPHIRRERRRSSSRGLAVALTIGGLIGASIAGAAIYSNVAGTSTENQIAIERTQRERSEAATRTAQEALVGERAAKEQFQRAAQLIEAELGTVKTESALAEEHMRETETELAAQIAAFQTAQSETSLLQDKLSEAEKQRRAVEQSLTEQLDKANASVTTAEAKHAALEATLTQRVFHFFEASLREEQSSRKASEAARMIAEAELGEARKGRQHAEAALQSALANLKVERQAREEAEQRAGKLREQLAARSGPTRKVNRVKAQPRPRPVTAAKKAPTAQKLKTSNAETVFDIGFEP